MDNLKAELKDSPLVLHLVHSKVYKKDSSMVESSVFLTALLMVD